MVKQVEVTAVGGPEAMVLVERDLGEPGSGEIRIRHHAIGVNYIDVYHRSGLYPLPTPFGVGLEGAGVVEAIGEGVTHLAVGDRAAYVGPPPGAYAEARVMPAAMVRRLPDALDFEQGAAMMLQGLTVQYLFRQTARLAKGDTVLFHAAAGGVGLIACQWAKAMGVKLIGTAGTDEKCALALRHGATHAINYRTENFVERVAEITDGAGVPVVMDSVGKDTWEGSLDCLSPLGLMISFGNASGKAPPVELGDLAAKGSLFVTRPTLFTFLTAPGKFDAMVDDLFAMVESGAVKVEATHRYPLAEVQQAHRDLEARKTTGAIVLLP